MLQQSPGGTQQLVNIVQTTPQGVVSTTPRPATQQIVIQAAANPPTTPTSHAQVQVTQTTVHTPNAHQIVIQKQGIGNPTGISTQQQVPAPPQMQVQTKTVIVKQQNVMAPTQTTTPVEEKPAVNETPEPEPVQMNGEVHKSESETSGNGAPTIENGSVSTSATNSASQSPTVPTTPSQTIQMIPAMDPTKIVEEDVDPSWLWVCDWRGCPK